MFKIFKFIKGKALLFAILGIVFMLLGCACDILQPYLLQNIVDCVAKIQDGDTAKYTMFWNNIAIMGGAAGIGLIMSLVSMFCGAKSSLLAVQYLRSAMYQKILGYSFSNIDKYSTGSLITRISNDAQKFQMLVQMSFTILVRAPIMFVGGMILGFTMNYMLGFIVVGVCVIMLTTIILIGRNVISLFEKSQIALDDTNNVMRENILGMRVVKSFGIQEQQISRFRKSASSYKKYRIKAQTLMLPIVPVTNSCLQLGIVLVILFGGIMISKDPTSTFAGQMFAFTNIMMMILSSALMALAVIVQFIMSEASFKRILAVLNTESNIKDSKSPKQMPNDFDIKFDHVNFKYNKSSKENILNNISFDIKPGQFFGIIGGTGSGKSTLVNLIPRLYDISGGNITIGGVNVKDISLKDLRNNISVVLQENFLFQGNIKENLLYGDQKASDDKLIQACKDACAWDFVEKFDKQLEYPVDQRGRNFSGGQKQRLCIARALVKHPKVFIMDDSTSALDLITEAKVQDNIRKNYKDSTTIVVSQRVASIKNADQILVLENGKICGLGTHKELVKKCAVYNSIVKSQLGTEGLR